jgi:hypothetical protein
MAELIVGRDEEGIDRIPRIDGATSSFSTVSLSHEKIHNGKHYTITYAVADLGAATTPNDMMTLAFTTPNTTAWLHMLITATSAAGTRFRFIRGKTGGGGTGTGIIDAQNNNHNSSNTSSIINQAGTPAAGSVTYDSTLFTGGVSVIDVFIGTTGQGNAVIGGEARGDNENILKQDTEYQVSLFNTANVAGSISLSWYHHRKKN